MSSSPLLTLGLGSFGTDSYLLTLGFSSADFVLGNKIIPTYRRLTQSCFVGLKYNSPNQEFHLLAVNTTGKVSGKAPLITVFQKLDGGDRVELTDIFPTEIGSSGEYIVSLTQDETNANEAQFDISIPEPMYDIDGNPMFTVDGKQMGLPDDVETPTVQGFGLPSSAIRTTKQYDIYNDLFGSDP
jgi:hypothetical protein